MTDPYCVRRPDLKTTRKWAWLESRDPISKFWDPLITVERIELQIWYRHRHDGPRTVSGPQINPNVGVAQIK